MWNIEKECGYHPITTFWEDFTIAEKFGNAAIIDTYNRAFKEWKNNVKYTTELCMVLNWKIWDWYYKGNATLTELYNDLWEDCDGWCCKNYKGDDLDYFYRTTD